MSGLFERFNPQLVIIEMNFQYRNVRTTAMLNQLRGVILLISAQRHIGVEFIDNNTAKKRMLGGTRFWNGEKYVGVTKEMMLGAITEALCPDSALPADTDAADAIALGMAYFEADITPVALPRKATVSKKKAA